MAKLTDEQIVMAKAWLHDIFILADMGATPKRLIPVDEYRCMYGGRNSYRSRLVPAAKVIYDAIKFRQVDTKKFNEIDQALENFSSWRFAPSLDHRSPFDNIRKPANMLAKYIAWFCRNYEFWWADENISLYERDEIKNTIIGKALWDEGCFLSQPLPGTRAKRSSTTATTASQNTSQSSQSTGTVGQPKNPFKARGPLSSAAVDLLSTPNQKEHLAGPVVYCINGLDANGAVLEDTAYIRPVESDPKSQAKFVNGNTNKVLFGSAKGYGYCPVYFETQAEANEFYTKLQALGLKLGPKVTAMAVCKKNVLANGYFKIGTELGPVYISAAKLNEDLQENLAEESVDTKLTNKEKWERMENAFYHEL